MRQYVIVCKGKDHYEFNVRVMNYPERALLEQMDLPESQMRYLIGVGGNGIYVELFGYGRSASLLLKFKILPYLEFFEPCKANECLLDPNIVFHKSNNEDTLVKYMSQQLFETAGDPASCVEVLPASYVEEVLTGKFEKCQVRS